MTPSITVVITTYDRPDLVSRAIESVLTQTYENFECLVVDDCSPDDETTAVVESYDDDRLTYHRHPENRGLGAARNTGIERANGQFVAFLDDDDQWLPAKLQRQIECFEAASDEVGIIYCWMDYCLQDGTILDEYRPEYRGYILPHTLDGQPIGAGSTLLVRTSVARAVDGFDESLPRGIDGDFIRRVCRDWHVDFVPETLVKYFVEHGHERITNLQTEQDVRDVVTGKKTKLEKFANELERYPRRKASILAGIGYHYWLLREWRRSASYFLRALRTAPTTVDVYEYLARAALSLLPGRGVGRGT